jgi:hypothetical protein
MSKLATAAEIDKLAQTLAVQPPALAFLQDVPAEQLRAFRIAIYERLLDEDKGLFERLARLLARMPSGIAARMALRVGPLVTARTAAALVSRQAVEVAQRLPTPAAADIAAYLDPRRAHELLGHLPTQRIVDIALELLARRDFITMSRFVEYLPDDAIRAVVETTEDEGALLRVAFYMGSKNRLDHLFRMLTPQRLERMIVRVQEESEELLPAFLSLLIHVSYALKRELGDFAAQQDDAVLDGYIRATQEHGLWADMLPVVAAMSPQARRRVVNLAVLRDPIVQESIVDTADERRLWGLVLPMVELMDDANREAVASILARKDTAALEAAADAALMGEYWPALLDLVRRMPERQQVDFAAIVRRYGDVDPELVERVLSV